MSQPERMTAQPALATSTQVLDSDLGALKQGARDLAGCSLERRIELAGQCIEGVMQVSRRWVELSCRAKRIEAESRLSAEEITAGPIAVVRYLRLLIRTLLDIRDFGLPRLPGRPRIEQQQVCCPVFPARGLFDALLFYAMKAETFLQPQVGMQNLFGENIERISGRGNLPRVVAILGAGNVSSIPATDALTKILQESQAVLLKMNPVNEYLGDVFERAFSSLIDANFLRIAYGAAEVGSYTIDHDDVDGVHLTGSIETHDAIVWGPDTERREHRRSTNCPALSKPVTSELGNVSPWIIVPGRYSPRQLKFQVQNIVASITNNASFNCIATKVIVTWRQWPDRQRVLDLIQETLKGVPARCAYYPGAAERFARFSGQQPSNHDDTLPWTLLEDRHPDETPEFFQQESFVCVCVETALNADSPDDFLERAVQFANDRLWGTLAAALTVPTSVRRDRARLAKAIRALRYGTIGINQWPGIVYALMSPPWGGYPGGDLRDAQSGIGTVHNTFLLERPEKTVLSSPATMLPKPMWFGSHRYADSVAWKLLDLYHRPAVGRIGPLLVPALLG